VPAASAVAVGVSAARATRSCPSSGPRTPSTTAATIPPMMRTIAVRIATRLFLSERVMQIIMTDSRKPRPTATGDRGSDGGLGEGVDRGVVVRLVGDLVDELGVDDLAVLVRDDDGAGQQALQRGALQGQAVILTEGGT